MYELSQSLSALFLESTEKIYVKSSVDVTLYSSEYIPPPGARDIIIIDRGSLGKDITIRLNVQGQASGGIKTESLSIPVEVIDAGQQLDEQGVRDTIGSKIYNVTARVFKGGVEESGETGNVTKESDVEIE
jgi:hypothetical protein